MELFPYVMRSERERMLIVSHFTAVIKSTVAARIRTVGSGPGNRENEIKLRIASPEKGRRLLRTAGFRLVRRRTFEDNFVFDTPDQALRRRDCLVRVRVARGQAILTYKGPGEAGRHKSREEVETTVGDAVSMRAILDRLGYRPVFRYQKYRTEYSRGEPGAVATLDETPIGCFLELEGPPAWVDSAAAALGFSAAGYITASYGRLYLEYCRDRGLPPGDMVFPPSNTMSTI